MSVSVKAGFAIGFALAAIFGGAWAWREGLLKPADQRSAQMAPPSGQSSPGTGSAPYPEGAQPGTSEGTPGPRATPPSVTPTPQPTQPGTTPTPGAKQPSVTPPRAGPDANPTAEATPPAGAGATPGADAKQADKAVDERKGAFDVVRVEPSGDAVVAGRCAAGCTAELTANGRTIDTAKADASGSFAMTPPALPPGDHQLGLKVTTPDGAKATSEQSVTVSVPKAPSREVVVVLNEPDAPSKILQTPGQEPAAAPAADGRAAGGERLAARSEAAPAPAVEKVAALSLGAIDAEKGRFFVQGTAPAGSKLRIYLNNALISGAIAGADGRWSLRVERGLTSGRYVARVDHVDADGTVVKRAETGFDYEGEVAAAEPAAPAAPAAKDEPVAGRPDASGATAGQEPAAASSAAGQSGGSAATAEVKSESAGASAPAASDPQTAETPSGPDAAGDHIARRDRAAPGDDSGLAGEPAATAARDRTVETAAAQPSSGSPDSSGEPARSPETTKAGETAKAPDQPSSAKPAADPANPVVAQIDTAQVKRGDSLWRISRTTYGQGRRYTVIFSANDQQIRDPDLIYPGQVLVLPTAGAEASAGDRR